ncbi:MAG: uroporphyrinogen-III C-methyltransferase, partial [Candidatus Tectomicrobia bacterium]|nr:uroporphyrinogen-III C-methyltransferase [Candidatus Tectomicrobia bacterium]
MQEADVVIYDWLSSPDLLSLVPAHAELIYVGKRAGIHTLPQDKINQLLVEKARAGLRVVRLKGGDPFIFGRGGEEAETLAGEGIEFEVVPGITSAVAVPAYAGIPLTHREFSSSVAILTGFEEGGKKESSIDWEKISTGVGTLVFLMGVTALPRIVQQLVRHGRSPDTPVAVIQWGTTARQRTVEGTLRTIVELVNAAGLRPPAVTVVGDVVSLRRKLRWYESLPLFGKRIVVTRARGQAGRFSERLRQLGAQPLEFPVIEVLPPESWAPLDDAISRLSSFSWLIFTSANGVGFFVERLFAQGKDMRELKGVRVAAIGSETSVALGQRGLK